MGFLDKVKDTAKQVGDKAQELGDKGKEKLEDHKLHKQIEEHQTEIGGLVYAQRTGSGTPESDARIDELVAAITAAEQEIGANGTETSAAEPDAEPAPAATTADTPPPASPPPATVIPPPDS